MTRRPCRHEGNLPHSWSCGDIASQELIFPGNSVEPRGRQTNRPNSDLMLYRTLFYPNSRCSDDRLREVAVSAPSMVSPTYKMNQVFRSMRPPKFPDLERVWDGVQPYFCYDSTIFLIINDSYDAHGPIQPFTILDVFSKSESYSLSPCSSVLTCAPRPNLTRCLST